MSNNTVFERMLVASLAGLFLWQNDGNRLIFHSGAATNSGFRSQITIDPVRHVAAVVGELMARTLGITRYREEWRFVDLKA